MRTVLVTGGAGFIGSHVCARLLERDLHVVCLDSFDDAYGPEAKRDNVAALAANPRWTLVEGDVCDASLVAGTYRRFGVSATVHLAGVAGGRESVGRPTAVAEVSHLGTLTLLETAHRWGAYTFVYGSTAAVYGVTPPVPSREDETPTRPISPLGASALAAEALCHVYHRLYGLNVACLRLFTVYGPRQRPAMAIRQFADRLALGERVPRFGDGDSGRDYVHVDDVVAGVVAALDAALPFEIVNLGSGSATTLTKLVEMLASAMNRSPLVDALPDQPGEPPFTCADIGKARRLLAWEPRISLSEGLARFVEWHRVDAESAAMRDARAR